MEENSRSSGQLCSRSRRILVLNYEFPPIGGGGGAVSEQLSAFLAARGYEVRVQTAGFRDLPHHEQRDGYQLFRTAGLRRHADRCSVPEMFLYLMTNLWPVLRHVFFWKPDLIHVHFAVPTGVLAWLANRLARVPYVLTVHLGDVPGAQPEQTDGLFRILKPFTVPIWRRAARITAVSDFVRGLGERAYGREVTTIYNGITLPDPPDPSERSQTRLFFAGRFNPQKNLPFLIEVLAVLPDADWVCDLVGDGTEMAAVRQRRDQLGLRDRVHLHGWLARGEVQEKMAASDILVMPSLSEGFPVVAVEALAFGLAIVGSNIGGLADIVIDGDNGFLVPVNDTEAFAAALIQLIGSPQKRDEMRRNSRKRAERFDIERVVDAYEQEFRIAGGWET